MKNNISNVVIIGSGKLGTALIKKFDSLNMLSQVIVRNEKSISTLEKYIAPEIISNDIANLNNDFDLLIIAVSDINIEQVNRIISQRDLQGKIIAHCSGILNKNILVDSKNKNANIVAMHPYQTFFKYNENIFDNVGWGIDCDFEIKDTIKNLIEKLNGTPVFLSEKAIENKILYHSSAVMISNYFTTLISSAKEMAELAGIDPKIFFPAIVEQTLSNTLDSNEFPLTGLIARGDIKNLKLQIHSLQKNKNLLDTYCNNGLTTLELVYSKKIISFNKYTEIKQLFKKYK